MAIPVIVDIRPEYLLSGGDGLVITAGFAPGPWGPLLIADTPEGITLLTLVPSGEEVKAWKEISLIWPAATVNRDDARAKVLAENIFTPAGVKPDTAPLKLYLKGSPFQLSVWKALLTIPAGTAITYGELADRIGRPGAARAVGTAVSLNPVALLIPCHRVVRASGEIGNYRWGKDIKRRILEFEEQTLTCNRP